VRPRGKVLTTFLVDLDESSHLPSGTDPPTSTADEIYSNKVFFSSEFTGLEFFSFFRQNPTLFVKLKN